MCIKGLWKKIPELVKTVNNPAQLKMYIDFNLKTKSRLLNGNCASIISFILSKKLGTHAELPPVLPLQEQGLRPDRLQEDDGDEM